MLINKIDISTVSNCVSKAITTAAFEEGLKELQAYGVWNHETPEIEPNTKDYSLTDVAEVLHAYGVVFGYFAAKHRQKQEISKNLLTAAKDIFEECKLAATEEADRLRFAERELSCLNYLAFAYWRMGENRNARAYLDWAFSFDFPESHVEKIRTYIIESQVNLGAELFQQTVDRLYSIKEALDATDEYYLQGLFYMNTAIAKRELKDFDGALDDHSRASQLFKKINHRLYYCYNLNNTVNTYRAIEEKRLALQVASEALAEALQIGHALQIACVYDTLAHTVLDLDFPDAALWLSEKAVSEVKKTEAYGYFVAYSKTKIQILFKLNRFDEAFTAYADTINIAQDFVSEDVCKGLTKAVAELMRERVNESYKIPVIELPPERKPSPYTYIDIPSNRYETLGFKKGFIAVVCKEEVKTGDLVLVSHLETGFDYFGYADFIYDDFFGGMVWLDAKDGKEARVFSVDEVEVLKVAKFGLQDKNGKFEAMPLKFE